MKTQKRLLFFAALCVAILVVSCNKNAGTNDLLIAEISVSIPPEFEQNDAITQFILEYQSLINDFNQLAAQIMAASGINIVTGEERISGEHLTQKSLKREALLTAELSEVSQNRDAMMATMESKLQTLTEPEQRALRGVIAKIDSRIGHFDGSDNTRESVSNPEPISQEGQFEYPLESAGKDKFSIILVIAIGAFLLVFRILFRKGISQRGSFKNARKTSFSQGLSHMASEMKGNFEKIPVEDILNNPDISEEERRNFEKGEAYISSLMGQKTMQQADINGMETPEDAPPVISYENLEKLFDGELKGSLTEIESKRKGVLCFFSLALLMFVLIFPVSVLITTRFHLNILLVVALIIASVGFFILGVIRYLKFRSEYKSSVVRKVVQFINPKYLYDPNKHISLNDFILSRIGDKKINKAAGDDYICGKIDKTVFEFSELVAQYEWVDTDHDGKKVTRVENYFNGLFFLADFNKHIQGETFVFPDTVERILGKFGQKIQKNKRGDLVKLENPEFEKYYAVFSTDQTEARYILTPAMMEGLVNIRKKTGANCYFSFIGERVYCGIELNKAMFEASVFKSLKFKDIEFMHSVFMLIETIITEMNLNTRIWTKQ